VDEKDLCGRRRRVQRCGFLSPPPIPSLAGCPGPGALGGGRAAATAAGTGQSLTGGGGLQGNVIDLLHLVEDKELYKSQRKTGFFLWVVRPDPPLPRGEGSPTLKRSLHQNILASRESRVPTGLF